MDMIPGKLTTERREPLCGQFLFRMNFTVKPHPTDCKISCLAPIVLRLVTAHGKLHPNARVEKGLRGQFSEDILFLPPVLVLYRKRVNIYSGYLSHTVKDEKLGCRRGNFGFMVKVKQLFGII